MRILEIAAFLTVSGALHVAALTLAPSQSGGSGGDDGGVNEVTLQAATPTLAAMVEDWSRPPEVSDAPSLLEPVAQPAPSVPTQDAPVMPDQTVAALPQPSDRPAMPDVETRLPAPLTPFAAPAPAAPEAPRLAAPPALDAPAVTNAPLARAPATQLTAPQPTALPQIDTADPAPRYAPLASARPEPRPERRPQQAAPAPKPAQTAQQPAQKARGAGQQDSTAQAPVRRAPVVSGPSQAQVAQAQREWGARITRALRRAHRPPRGNAAGTVSLRLAISPAGRVQAASITQSSGHANLDQAALRAVQRARFPRAPKSLTKSVYHFNQKLSVTR